MLILIDQQSGKRERFVGQRVRIGRVPGNDLILPVGHISSRHAQIRHDGATYCISDLGSTNGSCVERDGTRLLLGPKGADELTLADGDMLLLGDIDRPERWKVEIVTSLEASGENTIVARRESRQTLAAAERLDPTRHLVPALLKLVERLAASTSAGDVLDEVVGAVLDTIPQAEEALIAAPRKATTKTNTVPGTLRLLAKAQRHDGGLLGEADATIVDEVLKRGEGLLFGKGSVEVPAVTLIGRGLGSGIATPIGSPPHAVLQINCSPTLDTVRKLPTKALTEADLDLALVLAQHATLALQKAELVDKLRDAKRTLREENTFLRRRAAGPETFVAESPQMRGLLDELDKAAAAEITILLLGETGTGKEVAAQRIHARSRRSQRLLVPVNCGALSETLLDSELFGHKKGAFTGAVSDKKGLFEIADAGTLFLDEIGDMPLSLQAKLLRVLQEGEVRPVGATRPKQVDVRIICATNRSLEKEVEAGRFRQDLYYRLMVFPVTLPPLRERQEDIPLLVQHFLKRYTAEMRKNVAGVSQEAINQLQRHQWPGNIRELENEVQRLVIQVDEGAIVQVEHLSPSIRKIEGMVKRIAPKKGTLKEMVESVERWILSEALKEHGNNKTKTAVTLGITREGLHKKLSKYGM
ncbi:MAG: sigma 54-interacting transcriptional regulator [Deltaproteobacteria bacterium]|nr:sigma 54-interacting transcriptional regulator [Deltaproteobacteria bacterium]